MDSIPDEAQLDLSKKREEDSKSEPEPCRNVTRGRAESSREMQIGVPRPQHAEVRNAFASLDGKVAKWYPRRQFSADARTRGAGMPVLLDPRVGRIGHGPLGSLGASARQHFSTVPQLTTRPAAACCGLRAPRPHSESPSSSELSASSSVESSRNSALMPPMPSDTAPRRKTSGRAVSIAR